MGRRFPEAKPTYTLFNGEYPWSYSCDELQLNQWYSYEAKTDESYTVVHTEELPEFYNDLEDGESDYTSLTLKKKTWEEKKYLTKNIGDIISTYAELSWGEQYDFSNKDSYMNLLFPSKFLYEGLRLHQKDNHGYYYDENDELVAFDGRLTKLSTGLLIKKKQLTNFMNEENLRIFWTCLGEKQYIYGTRNQIWSEWSGFLYLEENKIVGKMKNMKSKK